MPVVQPTMEPVVEPAKADDTPMFPDYHDDKYEMEMDDDDEEEMIAPAVPELYEDHEDDVMDNDVMQSEVADEMTDEEPVEMTKEE